MQKRASRPPFIVLLSLHSFAPFLPAIEAAVDKPLFAVLPHHGHLRPLSGACLNPLHAV